MEYEFGFRCVALLCGISFIQLKTPKFHNRDDVNNWSYSRFVNIKKIILKQITRMQKDEIIVKASIGYSLSTALTYTILFVCFIVIRNNKYIWLNTFSLFTLQSILLLTTLLASIFYWLKVFDIKPKLVINADGIQLRSNLLPFSKLKSFTWETVSHFYFAEMKQKTVKEYLFVAFKGIERESKVNLYGLNKSKAGIKMVLRTYQIMYKFQELGINIR